MANQDYGRGQQYDQDTTDDQWAQQGGQQEYDQFNQGMQGQQYDADPSNQGNMSDPWSQQGGMGSQNPNTQQGGMDDQDQWSQQQGGLSDDPLSQDSPFGEDEQQGMSRRDRAEGGDIDSAFGNP